jgi:phosphomannomutase
VVDQTILRQQEVSIADYRSQSWIMRLEDLPAWTDRFTLDSSDRAIGFCSIKRWLTEFVEDEAVLGQALALMETFLLRTKAMLAAEVHPSLIPSLFGTLMTVIGEAGPYRYETKKDPQGVIWEKILGPMEKLRFLAVDASKALFAQPVFAPIRESIEKEIYPLLDVAVEVFGSEHDQFMPFRIIQAGKVAERLLELAEWLHAGGGSHEALVHLLHECYDLKYPRFGTSGLRGVWEKDFTVVKARRTSQAICMYLAGIDMPEYVTPRAQDLSGKWIVVGYDGRLNSDRVGTILAEVALANGFPVYISSRPTPTPAIAFFATEVVGKDNLAGIINCTASHNPPEWQGIKFNPKEGYPAPTHLTDIIAARINEMQLLDVTVQGVDIDPSEPPENIRYYDPIMKYQAWIEQNGQGNGRIPINFERLGRYFRDKLVVIDEMHGAGNGYLEIILGGIGVPFKVMHHERDPRLGGQDYANPELPYITPLMDEVKRTRAVLGLGLDTDADRFGVVDQGGEYFRPNQILTMLSYYLGHDLELSGRIVITQTGMPMIDVLARGFPNIERPTPGVIPPYIDHAFYKRRLGEREDNIYNNVFVVPVGIKYIVEVPRLETDYSAVDESRLPSNWMNGLLMGGEESSGLTSRGHIPDKDGVWANLLIMDMIAYYGQPLKKIWEKVASTPGGWNSYGGRLDVDASDRAKEKLISYYLDLYQGRQPGEVSIAGAPVLYAGGTRYDMVEIFLGDKENRKHNFLRIRASGTEPINRIYAETSDPELWEKLFAAILGKLDEFTTTEIEQAYRVERLADLLATTKPGSWEKILGVAQKKMVAAGWKKADLIQALKTKLPVLENRNRDIVEKWLELLQA